MTDERELFRSAASYYARYRAPWPRELFDHLVSRFRLDGTRRLLDLGCGTGEIALPLAPRFRDVVAVDPEPEMLAEGRRKARDLGVANVTWIEGSSDDLSALRDRFFLVTMGCSFHWMDRDAVLAELDRVVEPDGGIVVVVNSSRPIGPEWDAVVKEAVRRHLGERRRAGKGWYAESAGRHEEALARSAFSRVEEWNHSYVREATVDEVVGFQFSTSYASPAVLGEKRETFERDLRGALAPLAPEGVLRHAMEVTAYLATRPGSGRVPA